MSANVTTSDNMIYVYQVLFNSINNLFKVYFAISMISNDLNL